ncbi:MAG: GspMb/PilO family protein [Elsteraceae bacterium]
MSGWRDQFVMTPLARIGALLIGILATAFALVSAPNLVDETWRLRERDLRAELEQGLRLAANGPAWAEARRRAESDAAGLSALSWRASSESQARAMIQDWLSQSLTAQGAERATVRIDRVTPAGAPDLVTIQATVTGGMPTPALERWLGALAGADRLVVVERLRVQSQPAARFEAALTAPVKLGSAP